MHETVHVMPDVQRAMVQLQARFERMVQRTVHGEEHRTRHPIPSHHATCHAHPSMSHALRHGMAPRDMTQHNMT